MFQSVGTLNTELFTGGQLLNVRINPSTLKTEEDEDKFIQILKAAGNLHCWHSQYNVVSNETLRDAQKHPENYQDLMVRVAGYNALFTSLNQELQEDIMGRHEQREQVFKLLYRVEFHAPEDMPEQIALFRENNEEVPSWQDADAIAARFEKIREKIPELDRLLNENTEGWDTTRMGKVELAVLRLGAYELRYDDDIPNGVAINEAIEIAKKYGQESSGGFVNAILAKIMKSGE